MNLIEIGALALAATTTQPRSVVDLSWNAPAECPAKQNVVDQISKLLGSATPAEPLSVQAAATQRPDGGWSMHLSTPAGERTFDGDSCARLADATALIVALIIVPSAGETPAVAQSVSEPTPTPKMGAPSRILIRPEVSALGGPLPGASGGPGLAVGVQLSHARLELDGAWSPPQGVTLGSGAGAQLSLSVRGGVSGCWIPTAGALEADICLGAQAGLLRGRGLGVDNPVPGQTWWLGIYGGGALAYPIVDWLWVRLSADLGYQPNQAKFVLQGVGLVYQVPGWTAKAALGAEARF